MKIRLLIALLLAAPVMLNAQAASRTAQKSSVSSLLATNGTGAITAANVRTVINSVIDSAYNSIDDGTPLYSTAIGSTLQAHSAALDTFSTNGSAYYLSRANHTGTQALSTLSQSGATTNQVASWSGTAWVPVTLAGGGDALVANPLSQFAATTSAQLRGVLSDEVGTGAAYFVGGDLGTPAGAVGTNFTGTGASFTAGNATKWTTGRTVSITGDIAYTSGSLDGSGNVTGAGTLATVNSNVGSFGSATQSLTATVNAKGLVTAMSAQTVTPAVGSITGLGTGVATALANATNAAGGFTPIDGTATLTNKTINGASNTLTVRAASDITGQLPVANGGTGSSTAAAANQALTVAAHALTESSNATTIDWALGNTHTLTLNANLTSVTFSNPVDGQTIVVAITNTASNYTVTWGNSIKWVGGTQPVQTVGAHIDVWTIIKIGSAYYGNVVQNF